MWQCGDGCSEGRTIHARHAKVDEDGIERWWSGEALERELAGGGGLHDMSKDAQQPRDEVDEDGVVVDDEHTQRWGAPDHGR